VRVVGTHSLRRPACCSSAVSESRRSELCSANVRNRSKPDEWATSCENTHDGNNACLICVNHECEARTLMGDSMRKIFALLAAASLITIASPTSAATLLDVTNLPVESVIPQNFTFTATSASTKIDFQGYQVPGSITLVNLFLAATGTAPSAASNLLGLHYAYTPSSCASPFHAFEGSDPPAYGANNLNFEGACAGLYDSLAQTVNTTNGTAYTLSFSLSNSAAGSNGLRITATDPAATGAVPEPATWAMMLLGFSGIGFAMRRSRPRTPAQIA
jgi:hypothetical protein